MKISRSASLLWAVNNILLTGVFLQQKTAADQTVFPSEFI